MLHSVVHEMTALAQRLQVSRPILGWIMVEVGTGKHHARLILREATGQFSGGWQPPQKATPA